MTDLFARSILETRRLFLIAQKKASLFSYNIRVKTQMGQNVDAL